MTITEGNKLIAEFMGWRFPERCDNDWNKLMPVVEKIGQIYIDDPNAVERDERCYLYTFRDNMTRFYCCALHHGSTQIESTWNAVVDFIQMENERKKPKDNL